MGGVEVGGVARPQGSFVQWVSELARVHARGLAAAARREGLGPEDQVITF